ncbi:MAG TPA: L,D-transpeptidase [Kofleriaceae bacterium]|nr:L,D-transpeptidase [Kofleriaceae bacterium]
MLRCRLPLLLLATWAACAEPEPGDEGTGGDELPLGDMSLDDWKADGQWGAALTCKTAPDLPVLARPAITVSLDGLTLRLTDQATGWTKVFPVGVGALDWESGSYTRGESLTYYPIKAYGTGDFAITPASTTPCKFWWTDPETGQKLPVFAGLPFMSWSGSYAIHGPIDNYRAANGGTLRRGYVSHGCVRMRAEDVLEVYARIKGVARVPVHVQREAERDSGGDRVDLEPSQRWLGAECTSDADCPWTGGFCKDNPYSGRGFCSARCTTTCADKAGYPTTFCVADPQAPGQGMCVMKETAVNDDCRPYDHLVARTTTRNTQSWVSASVCLPGSPGWIGDQCFADSECHGGNHCLGASAESPGICTQGCSKYCPDEAGSPATFCVNEALAGGGTCERQCTPASNASECPADTACVQQARNGDPATRKYVCDSL